MEIPVLVNKYFPALEAILCWEKIQSEMFSWAGLDDSRILTIAEIE